MSIIVHLREKYDPNHTACEVKISDENMSDGSIFMYSVPSKVAAGLSSATSSSREVLLVTDDDMAN